MTTTYYPPITSLHIPMNISACTDEQKITVPFLGKLFNALPLLMVVLEDFKRPQELAAMLEYLLKADLTQYKMDEKPLDYAIEDRRYFVGCLIAALKAGANCNSKY